MENVISWKVKLEDWMCCGNKINKLVIDPKMKMIQGKPVKYLYTNYFKKLYYFFFYILFY